MKKRRIWTRLITLLAVALALTECSGAPPPRLPAFTQQRPLGALMTLTAYPNSEAWLALATMQQFRALHREWEGYEYFGRLADTQPSRSAFFGSLQGILQARVAKDVPLLRRVAWVEDAIAKLDRGARADPLLGRLGRGLTCAELPARFEKARQAVDDLNFVLERQTELPFELSRGIYRGLAAAYRTLGDEARSREMLARAGLRSLDDANEAMVLGDLSVDGARGFRFGKKALTREADGVYVAEGYDFSNLAFIVARDFVVAIDAGTTERTAREAVLELRRITRAPIKYVILTHGHWDHVGGLAAVREPGTTVIARAGFDEGLQRARDNPPPFEYFFGKQPVKLDVRLDRPIEARETLHDGDLELELIPAPSGETEDALFVLEPKSGLLFVGDAFMPYLGAPFVAEGSAEGFLGAIDRVLEERPRRLIHGHTPLTRVFTMAAMPGLREAMRALYAHALQGARGARALADVLHDDFVPTSLRGSPAAAQPYLVVRDTFVQRVFLTHAGYWRANGDGIDVFTRGEWASALDLMAGGGEAPFVRAATELERRGDAGLALQIADLGLSKYPSSAELRASRERALVALRALYAQTNPFRFIVYSEWAGRGLSPVNTPPIDANASR